MLEGKLLAPPLRVLGPQSPPSGSHWPVGVSAPVLTWLCVPRVLVWMNGSQEETEPLLPTTLRPVNPEISLEPAQWGRLEVRRCFSPERVQLHGFCGIL